MRCECDKALAEKLAEKILDTRSDWMGAPILDVISNGKTLIKDDVIDDGNTGTSTLIADWLAKRDERIKIEKQDDTVVVVDESENENGTDEQEVPQPEETTEQPDSGDKEDENDDLVTIIEEDPKAEEEKEKDLKDEDKNE